MFDAAKFVGFVNTLTIDASKLTNEASRALLIKTADEARDRVLGGTPKPSGFTQAVDGNAGASFNTVRPDGTIILFWQYLGEIARDARDAMVQYAPEVSGNYINNILVLVDGTDATLDDITGDTKQVAIVAGAQYARRLEVGNRESGAPFVLQVPQHNVELIARMMQRLYTTTATIDFAYVDLPLAHEIAKASGHRRRGGRVETAVRYPAIIIEPRGG